MLFLALQAKFYCNQKLCIKGLGTILPNSEQIQGGGLIHKETSIIEQHACFVI